MTVQPGQGRGRPRRQQAPTAEVATLSGWLDHLIGKRTTRDLERLFKGRSGPSKSIWALYLNGGRLITLPLLERLVTQLVTEPRLREVRLAEGRDLWRKANQSIQGKLLPAEMGLSERELRRRLVDAQHATIEAQRKHMDMTQLVSLLLLMTVTLRRRCADLEQHQQESDLQLVQYRKRLDSAEEQLGEARQRQEEAEMLHLEASRRVEVYQRALEQAEQPTMGDQPSVSAPADSQFSPGPALADYDDALHKSEQLLQQTGQDFAELRDRLGLTTPEENPSSPQQWIVRGQVLDNSAGPDQDTATAGNTPPGHPVNNPPGGPGRPRRASARGRGPLTALAVAVCLALLTGGGWIAWDQLHDSPPSKPQAAKPSPPVSSPSTAAPPPALEITATSSTTVIVRKATAEGGRVLYNGTLEAGQTKQYPKGPLEVVAMDGGAVTVKIYGKVQKRATSGERGDWRVPEPH